MKYVKQLTIVAIVLWLVSISVSAYSQFRVVGYIPNYKNLRAQVDTAVLQQVTHLNISFVNPNASGAVVNGAGETVCTPGATASDISYVVNRAHAHGVKVLISLAGGAVPACSGNWFDLLQPWNRTNVIRNLMVFVTRFNLDGIDVDIEGALLNSTITAGNYTPFIRELGGQLKAQGKLITAATPSYVGGMIPIDSLPYFDFVNLMSYDAVGPWTGATGGEHSSYAAAQAHINLWISRGLPREKLVLGVPFYGYGFGQYGGDWTYSRLVNTFGSQVLTRDIVGAACSGCSYITFNSVETIKRKTQLALNQSGGIMIWELSQDGIGNASLLNAISAVIGENGGTVNPAPAPAPAPVPQPSTPSGPCSAWSPTQYYNQGDIVLYSDGNYYIAEHDNPGYIPVVSTWFWDPVAACGSLPAPAPAPISQCEMWEFGKNYNQGTVVRYEDGNYYVAEHDNPGYIPVVSTWFWEPTDQCPSGNVPGNTCEYPQWNRDTSYLKDDIVMYSDGNYYIAEYDNPGYIPTVSTWFWNPVTPSCN